MEKKFQAEDGLKETHQVTTKLDANFQRHFNAMLFNF